MADRQKSHFGGDGYKELYLKQELANRDGKAIRNKILAKLKDEEYERKKKSQRSSKNIVPRGSGKHLTGDDR